tara:strand:- start:1102 stop:1326 length:225 start_codon:yes stop_codon:yes gene_type:complete
MSEFISINNNEDLVRDSHSKAILNTNLESLEAWKRRKEKSKRIETHEKEINTIRKELDEIKSMVEDVLRKISNG